MVTSAPFELIDRVGEAKVIVPGMPMKSVINVMNDMNIIDDFMVIGPSFVEVTKLNKTECKGLVSVDVFDKKNIGVRDVSNRVDSWI